jgi:hypothetical protein
LILTGESNDIASAFLDLSSDFSCGSYVRLIDLPLLFSDRMDEDNLLPTSEIEEKSGKSLATKFKNTISERCEDRPSAKASPVRENVKPCLDGR